MSFLSLITGRRLANREHGERKIGWLTAVPAMGLDGLGSSSYGPEAALSVLAPLGATSLDLIGPIMGLIVFLLAVLYLSYRQTIIAYPTSGGAYTVAKENLGQGAGLLAASALMIDYVLNVAVGISAGVGALTSIAPDLHAYTLPLCLGVLALVTVANLRGTLEAGWLFAWPTYLFMASFLFLIGLGLWAMIGGGGHPRAVIAPPPIGPATGTAGLWLLMRAFASGCTAMTGVEAVSNGVGALKSPVTAQAHRTLTVICVTLGLLLAGIALLARGYGVGAMDQTRPGYQSVLSQLTAAVVGRGAAYDVAMVSLLCVLTLSANTSFVGFPRLCRLVAQDGFLPKTFAIPDRRLVLSVGVAFLALTAGGLLIAFGGITDRLIPLFAIGAFLTFALSQAGMVAHWRRAPGRHPGRLITNAVGAVTTAIAFGVILVAKFTQGAWITILAIPAAILLLRRIRRYYDDLDGRLKAEGPILVEETQPPTVLVTVEQRTRMTDRAIRFALTLSPDVVAVHLMQLEGPEAEEDGRALKAAWERDIAAPIRAKGLPAPRLLLVPAPFRRIYPPLLQLIEKLDLDTPGRSVAVLIPEMVLGRWWERVLHAGRAERLRAMLLKHGGPRLNVVITPWRSRVDGSRLDDGGET